MEATGIFWYNQDMAQHRKPRGLSARTAKRRTDGTMMPKGKHAASVPRAPRNIPGECPRCGKPRPCKCVPPGPSLGD